MNSRAAESTCSYAISGAAHALLLGILATSGSWPRSWEVRVESGTAAPVMLVAVAAPPEDRVPPLEIKLLAAAPPEAPQPLDAKSAPRDEPPVEMPELAAIQHPPARSHVAPQAVAVPLPAPELSSRPVAPPPQPRREPPRPLPKAETTLVSVPAPVGANVDTPPRQLPSNPAPAYPRAALAAQLQGRVVVRASIDADGAVQHVALDTSSGHRTLDDAALMAVRQWQFSPATHDGRPTSGDVLVPVRFVIRRG